MDRNCGNQIELSLQMRCMWYVVYAIALQPNLLKTFSSCYRAEIHFVVAIDFKCFDVAVH